MGWSLAFSSASAKVPRWIVPGNPEETALPARSLAELSSEMIGSEVAFENGDPRKPLISRIVDPVRNSQTLISCVTAKS